MKYSKPLTYFVCLLATGSALAAGEAAKPAAPAAPAKLEAAAAAPILRISAIDGVVNPNHKKDIKRRAGKKISFTADIFVKVNGKLVAQKASAQDFFWEINSYPNFKCDPARVSEHCKLAGIEITKDGIKLMLDQSMFDDIGFDQPIPEKGIPAKRSQLKLKVTYAKDKKLTDSIVIVDLGDLENQAEMEAATKRLEESSNSGIGGFLNSVFGSSTSSEDSAPSYRPGHSDDCSPYDSTPSCPPERRHEERENWRRLRESDPAMAERLRDNQRSTYDSTHPRQEWNRGGFNRDDRNFPAPAAPAAAAPAAPAPDRGHFGGRSGFGGGTPQPAPQVAPQVSPEQAKMIQDLQAEAVARGMNIKIIQTR